MTAGAAQANVRQCARFSNYIPLFACMIFALTQASWEGAKSLLEIFPTGANAKVDNVVSTLRIVSHFGYISLGIGCIISAYLWRKTKYLVPILATLACLAVLGSPYLIIPLAIIPSQLSGSPVTFIPTRSLSDQISASVVALFAGTFALLTLATPFPHQMNFAEGFYIAGTSATTMILIVGTSLAAFFTCRLFLGRGRWTECSIRLLLITLFCLYLQYQFYGILSRFDSNFDFAPMSKFCAVAVTLVIVSLIDEMEGAAPPRLWIPWALLLVLVTRSISIWFNSAEKDIPTIMAGDFINTIVPLLIGDGRKFELLFSRLFPAHPTNARIS